MVDFFNESFVIALCFMFFLYFAWIPIKKLVIQFLDQRIYEISNQLSISNNLKQEAIALLDKIHKEIEAFEEQKPFIVKNASLGIQKLIISREESMKAYLIEQEDLAMQSIKNKKLKVQHQMQFELSQAVINTAKAYLIETNNNSVTNDQIIDSILKKSP